MFLYHTTNNTWSPSMFDETSHFISAMPLTKTFSTFSSVVFCHRACFFAMSNRKQQRAQQRRTQNRSRQICEMDKGRKNKKENLFSFVCFVLRWNMPKCIQSDLENEKWENTLLGLCVWSREQTLKTRTQKDIWISYAGTWGVVVCS